MKKRQNFFHLRRNKGGGSWLDLYWFFTIKSKNANLESYRPVFLSPFRPIAHRSRGLCVCVWGGGSFCSLQKTPFQETLHQYGSRFRIYIFLGVARPINMPLKKVIQNPSNPARSAKKVLVRESFRKNLQVPPPHGFTSPPLTKKMPPPHANKTIFYVWMYVM